MRRGMAWLAAACLAFMVAQPAGARAMSVRDALDKIAALQKRGMILGAFSPDFPVLKRDVLDAGRTWRAQVKSARPPVCAPPSVDFTTDDAIAFLRRVPEADRATADASTAIVAGLNDRYRCH